MLALVAAVDTAVTAADWAICLFFFYPPHNPPLPPDKSVWHQRTARSVGGLG